MLPSDKSRFRVRIVSWHRLALGGLLLALLTAAGGLALEWWRFGSGTEGSLARADRELRGRFSHMTTVLDGVATSIASDPAAASALQAGPDAAKALFDVVDAHSRTVVDRADIAVTVFDKYGTRASAWAGRPYDLPSERIRGPRTWFVTPSPLGLRLVHVRPIGPDDRPLGVVAVEHPLSPAPAGATIAQAEYILDTRVGPASLRTQYEGAGDRPRPNSFLVHAPGGETLVEVSISPAEIAVARSATRRRLLAIVAGVLATTVLLLIGPLLDRRAIARDGRSYRQLTLGAAALLLAGAGLAYVALALAIEGGPDRYTVLLFGGVTTASLVALLASAVSRLRLTFRGRRRAVADARARFTLQQAVAGLMVAALVAMFDLVLRWALEGATVDLRHFSLHPWSADRLTLLAAILACHLAALWGGTLVLTTALARWNPTVIMNAPPRCCPIGC